MAPKYSWLFFLVFFLIKLRNLNFIYAYVALN